MTGVRISVEGTEQSFEQGSDDSVLRAALRAGVGIPYECVAGGCGSCRIQVIDGEAIDLWPEAPGRSDRDRRTGRLLACQTRVTTDATIRVRTSAEYVGAVRPVRRPALLVDRVPVTHDMCRLVLRTSSIADFLPGQFVSLHLPGVAAPRNYSMANLANDEGFWELIVRRVPGGAATTTLLDDVRVGDEIELDGPFGLATLRGDAERDIVCVAGGSGLAPMLSIARGAAVARLLHRHHLSFFYGARTPADVCGGDELAALGASGASVEFLPVVSTPSSAHGQPWEGATGFVHVAALDAFAGRLAEAEWYLAGPPPMSQALQTALVVDHGVPVDQVHLDRFF